MKNITVETYLSFCAIVLSAALLRLIPHIPNISPVGALALFSGVVVPGWGGFVLPIAAMILSDFFLGFHATIPYVYGSFLLIGGIGYFIRKNPSPLRIGIASISGSVLFYILTNFGVWATSPMYEKSAQGLLQSYMMGLPFFRNTLIGDLFYTIIFFVGYRVFTLLFVLMLPSRRKAERHIGNTV